MNGLSLLSFPDEVKQAERFDLLQGMFIACDQAWKSAIQPRMNDVRQGSIDGKAMKFGMDFFTEADTESERVIKESLIGRFGEQAFRIFGEEFGEYSGNLEADITVRIDPIDGTEAFKFGKPNWAIMIGAYIGRDAGERQIASVIYWPEYFNEVLYFVDGAGVFITNVTTGETTKVESLNEQDSLGEIIVGFHKHNDLTQRGNDNEIIGRLESSGTRVRSLTQTEVKEALQTGGKRAMILDGDFNEVDFISYSLLVKLGYRAYYWDGRACSVDDPSITNKKLLFVPPGKAGEEILEVVISASV